MERDEHRRYKHRTLLKQAVLEAKRHSESFHGALNESEVTRLGEAGAIAIAEARSAARAVLAHHSHSLHAAHVRQLDARANGLYRLTPSQADLLRGCVYDHDFALYQHFCCRESQAEAE